MTGKANLERANRLLAAADKVVTADAPNDLPVLLSLLDLALKARELKANLHWCPIPNDLDGEVERALWSLKALLEARIAVHA
jgi:hypothetical protein